MYKPCLVTRATENFVQDVNVLPEFGSDHRVITCTLNHLKPTRSDVTVTHRSILDREKFSWDINDSFSHGFGCKDDVNALVSIYNDTLLKIYDKHAPLKTITVKHHHLAKWYNDQLRHEKREKRRLERRYRKSGLTVDMEIFHEQTQKYNNLLEKTKPLFRRRQVYSEGVGPTCFNSEKRKKRYSLYSFPFHLLVLMKPLIKDGQALM